MSKLTVNSPIEQGGILEASYSGFPSYSAVYLYVEGGGGVNLTADVRGEGSVRFQIGEAPGTYALIAEGTDPYTGQVVVTERAAFIVTESGSGGDLGSGQFSGYIINVKLAEGVTQQTPLNFKAYYEANASVVDANMGWETKIVCEYAEGSSEEVRQHYVSTKVGGYMALQAGMAPSVDTQYIFKLYARQINGSWSLLATQPVTVTGSGLVNGGSGSESGSDSIFSFLDDIPKPVVWGALAVFVILIALPPGRQRTRYE